jgi:UDP-N-acetylmuramoylalanine--D-glutamate ligase
VTTLAEAVAMAASTARAGETVMLSPACSSFDQFRDYAERGELFKELVRAL